MFSCLQALAGGPVVRARYLREGGGRCLCTTVDISRVVPTLVSHPCVWTDVTFVLLRGSHLSLFPVFKFSGADLLL